MTVDHKRNLPFQKLYIYQTRSRVYVVGNFASDTKCRVLKLSRQDGASLEAVEDPSDYTAEECNNLLSRIHEGNANHGGLQLVCEAYGIIGCFRFTESYYLLVITKREYVGSICGHKVYRVADTQLLPLSPSGSARLDAGAQDSVVERRYRKLLLAVDLTKNFFFSHTYCLANTLQRNHDVLDGQDPCVYDNMFAWNSYLTRDLRNSLDSNQWTVPLIHGYWEQRVVSVFGRQITITLVARRSRHFAGTRFRKRGLNDLGQVANEVETEQVVDAGMDYRTGQPLWSSMVQVRGSIPLYWTQEGSSLQVKPDIVVQQFDPLYSVTAAHLADLRQRYGDPIVVLNLLKSREKRAREGVLRKALAEAITLINGAASEPQQVRYFPWDFNQIAKQPGSNLLLEMSHLTQMALGLTGIYLHNPLTKEPANARQAAVLDCCPKSQRQHGVLRTNCIDCLDRTNVAQFAYGLTAFGRQLHDLCISDSPEVDSDSSVSFNLMEMYEAMGHTLALQYGGSEAHAVFFQRKKGEWEAATQGKDLFTSIRRFYSNAYTDSEKQDAINLFLGNFVPLPGRPHLWDLETDYYLHTGAWARYSLHSQAMAPLPVPTYSPADSGVTMMGTLPSPFVGHSVRDSSLGVPRLAGRSVSTCADSMDRVEQLAVATRSGAATRLNHLLPAPYQDAVALVGDPPGAEPSSWDLRQVLGQLVAPSGPQALARTNPLLLQLVSFDDVLALQPKVRQVRLYQGSQRRNIMWAAVQQAFTFFWTLQEGMSEPLPQGFTAADLAALRQQVTSSSPSGSPTAYQASQPGRTSLSGQANLLPPPPPRPGPRTSYGGHTTTTIGPGTPITPRTTTPTSLTSPPVHLAPIATVRRDSTRGAPGGTAFNIHHGGGHAGQNPGAGTLSNLLNALDPGKMMTALATLSSPKATPPVPVLNDIIEIQQHRPGVKYLTGSPGEAMGNTAEYYSPRGGRGPRSPGFNNPTAVPVLSDIIEIKQKAHPHPAHLMAAVVAASADASEQRARRRLLASGPGEPFKVMVPTEVEAAMLYSSSILHTPGPIALPDDPPPGTAAVAEPSVPPTFDSYAAVCYHPVAEHVTGSWGGSVPQWPVAKEFLTSDTTALGLRCETEIWWSGDRGRRGLWHSSEGNCRAAYQGYLASVCAAPDPLLQRSLEGQYDRYCNPLAMLAT